MVVNLKGDDSKRFMDKQYGANDLPRLGMKALWVVRVTLRFTKEVKFHWFGECVR